MGSIVRDSQTGLEYFVNDRGQQSIIRNGIVKNDATGQKYQVTGSDMGASLMPLDGGTINDVAYDSAYTRQNRIDNRAYPGAYPQQNPFGAPPLNVSNALHANERELQLRPGRRVSPDGFTANYPSVMQEDGIPGRHVITSLKSWENPGNRYATAQTRRTPPLEEPTYSAQQKEFQVADPSQIQKYLDIIRGATGL